MHMAGTDAPKYRQLADDLRARIRSGEYAPGSQVPSKAALMDSRHLSLGTVNKAIDILIGEGLLRTEQGTGTFVCDPLPAARTQEGPRGDALGQVAELREDVVRVELNLADLYAKLGFDYPRDTEDGSEDTGTVHGKRA